MITQNKNLLALTGFKLKFDDDQMDNVAFFAVSATMPGVTSSEVLTPFRNNSGFVPGDKLEYETLTIRLALDETLSVYNEIFSWMFNNTQGPDMLKTRNLVLSFMTSHNNVSRQVRFTRTFPTSIGSVEFNTQTSDVEYAYIDVSFRYDSFSFV
jgi:hypothetical protein